MTVASKSCNKYVVIQCKGCDLTSLQRHLDEYKEKLSVKICDIKSDLKRQRESVIQVHTYAVFYGTYVNRRSAKPARARWRNTLPSFNRVWRIW